MVSWILKLIQKYKTRLTLQQQLLICSFLLLTITYLLIYVAMTIITNIIADILINSSTIMYEKQTKKMIYNYNNLQSNLFQTYLSINDNRIIGIQQLFLHKDYMQIDLQIPNIIQQEQYLQSQGCYTNLSFYDESNQYQKINTLFFEFLSTFVNLVDFTNQTTYFAYGSDPPNIYFTYPCKSEIPSQTVWQDKISEIDLNTYVKYKSVIYQPQKSILNKNLQFTQVLPLIDNQKQIQGILGANTLYNFENINTNFNNIEVHILIVKYNGKIIFQDLVNSQLEYIFDQEISGFSYDDWLYMINLSNHHSSQDCFSMIPDQQVCLQNNILQKQYLIYYQNHSDSGYYSFILVNNNALFEQQRVENIIQKQLIDQMFQDMLYNIIAVVIISFILLYVVNKKVFKPLYKMGKIRIDQNVSHFKEILELQSNKNTYILKNLLIDQLIHQYLLLTKRIQNQVFQKDRICKLIENFKFPQTGIIDSFNILSIIRNKIQNTKNKIKGNLFQTNLFETTDQTQKIVSTRLIRMVSIESQKKFKL